jgi:hypothetical protein
MASDYVLHIIAPLLTIYKLNTVAVVAGLYQFPPLVFMTFVGKSSEYSLLLKSATLHKS